MDSSLQSGVLMKKSERDKKRNLVIFLLGDMVRYTSAHHFGYGLFTACHRHDVDIVHRILRKRGHSLRDWIKSTVYSYVRD